MKKQFLVAIILVGCSSFRVGTTNTFYEEIAVDTKTYSSVVVKGNMNITLTQNEMQNTIQYTGGKISAKVEDGEKLELKNKSNFMKDNTPTVTLPTPKLTKLVIEDDTKLVSDKVLKFEKLYIEVKGKTNLTLSLDATEVTVYQSGNSKVEINGTFSKVTNKKLLNGGFISTYTK